MLAASCARVRSLPILLAADVIDHADNAVNGVPSCASKMLLTDNLRTKWVRIVLSYSVYAQRSLTLPPCLPSAGL